jgi:hypothetical protein
VERVVLNALTNLLRLRRLLFAPSAMAIVFREDDPPGLRLKVEALTQRVTINNRPPFPVLSPHPR